MKMTQVIDPDDRTTGGVTSGEIDMQGWNGAMFLMPVGALGGVLDLAIYSSTTAGGALVAITGAAITQMTGGQDNHVVAIDIYRPTNRFLKAVMTVATSGDSGVVALQYDPAGNTPITQPATVSEVVTVVEN